MSGRTCMEAALSKLNYRMRSSRELSTALRDLGYDEEEIRDVMEELENFGYIDDMRFSEEFIRSSARKNKSSSGILRSLKEKGISSEMAEAAMENYLNGEGEESSRRSFDRERALQAGMKMAEEQISRGKETDERFLAKVGRRLTGLGYDSSTCYYVIGRIKEKGNAADDSEEMF